MSGKNILALIVVFMGGLGAGYAAFGMNGAHDVPAGAAVPAPVSGPVSAASSAVMTETDVRRIVEAYIIENPTVIMASVDDYQRNGFMRDMETRAEPFLAHLEDMTDAAVVGPANADVKIIEFFDYQCPHCKANYPVLQRLLENDPNVVLLPKHLPILGDGSESDMSLFAARAAEAARLQGKFAVFHEGLMARQAPLTRAGVVAVAQANGLDMAAFEAAINSEAVRAAISDQRAVAQDIGIMQAGTPGYIIGGKVMIGAGADAYERLKALVDEARASAGTG